MELRAPDVAHARGPGPATESRRCHAWRALAGASARCVVTPREASARGRGVRLPLSRDYGWSSPSGKRIRRHDDPVHGHRGQHAAVGAGAGAHVAGARAHDALARAAVEGNRGIVVKMTGDGMYAAFADPADGLNASLTLQQSLADPAVTNGIPLRVRCGLHLGVVERRDNDYFGPPVNRTARIMGAAHGGQILCRRRSSTASARAFRREVTLRDLGGIRLKDLTAPEHVYQIVHPRAAPGFPGAALARGDAQQPAAAAHVVRRPRARDRRGRRRFSRARVC